MYSELNARLERVHLKLLLEYGMYLRTQELNNTNPQNSTLWSVSHTVATSKYL